MEEDEKENQEPSQPSEEQIAQPQLREISEALSETEKVEETVLQTPPAEKEIPTSTKSQIQSGIETSPSRSTILSLLEKAREKIRQKREKKLEKILELARKKNFITNDEVEKLLHVSDATATRYLSQLVKEGKLVRIGPQKRPQYKLAQMVEMSQ